MDSFNYFVLFIFYFIYNNLIARLIKNLNRVPITIQKINTPVRLRHLDGRIESKLNVTVTC